MTSSAEVRAHLIAALEADLIGPFDPEVPNEVLELSPSRWYLTGFLAPAGARETKDPTAEDELGVGSDEDEEESAGPEPEAKQRNLFPASMGMSVLLPARAAGDAVQATVSFAEYVPEDREVADRKRPKTVWRRVPRGPFTVEVPLDAARVEAGVAIPDCVGVWLKGRLADCGETPGLPPGTRALSLFVVNERAASEEAGRADEQFLFQVKLVLEHAAGLVARADRRGEVADEWDDNVADLQFRDRFEWAVGHNASVLAPVGERHATRVETTWLPHHEVKRVVTRDESSVETSMEALAELPDGATAQQRLLPLLDTYGAWLIEQKTIVVDSKRREATRDALLKKAGRARDRIREGITLLAGDAELFEAFTLANRAMAMAARQRRPDAEPKWRLFQLAFVLMSLPALANPKHSDRELVDLIFFPTGGGKTEAYLGVIAVTLLLRRIRARGRLDAGLGVAVLLRYTLRLLTLDQLGRAATLVCALEELRRSSHGTLGDVRFSVGLWVGKAATANTMKQVAERILEYKANLGGSPCPLTHCPWCFTELGRDSLVLAPSRANPLEVVVGCVAPSCAFSAKRDPAGLPVLFVDEQIYRELPAFVVGTVDKFAMLPWRGETGMLFGRALAREGRRFYGPLDQKPGKSAVALPEGLWPPELIVQDELHLIAGPLGTMVGLYETAVEHLTTRTTSDGTMVRPKVIASTATVRRAREQIRSLFGRAEMALFPPPSVDDSETFFARVDTESAGRLYVGVAAPGRSMKAILRRAYIDLLCAAQQRFEARGPAAQPADPYMTLVGYFNSLRELGGMRRLVEDEVRTQALSMSEREPLDRIRRGLWFGKRQVQGEPVELTSRESTANIAKSKARLALPHGDKDHVDVLLASNMISVGVDIDRLGLMVVAGQPKTTAEYIQASSRVGRQHPGLVVTCFNVRKPRDRSHYERFAAYHASFYRFVEAQSLTPFSGPALERGLAGTLVAMTRLSDVRATPPDAVMDVATTRPIGERATNALAARAAQQPGVDGASLTRRGRNLLDSWDRLVKQIAGPGGESAGGRIHYSPYDKEKASVSMLHTALDDERPDMGTDYPKFRAPTSMRDVESSVHLWIERGRLGGKR
jgi:hypothetical protein